MIDQQKLPLGLDGANHVDCHKLVNPKDNALDSNIDMETRVEPFNWVLLYMY